MVKKNVNSIVLFGIFYWAHGWTCRVYRLVMIQCWYQPNGGSRIWKKGEQAQGVRGLAPRFFGQFSGFFTEFGAKRGGHAPLPHVWIRACQCWVDVGIYTLGHDYKFINLIYLKSPSRFIGATKVLQTPGMLILTQCLWRWTNITPAVDERVLFYWGVWLYIMTHGSFHVTRQGDMSSRRQIDGSSTHRPIN